MDDKAPVSDATSQVTSRYRWVALGLLVSAYACSFVDRQVLSILQQAIKVDLNLSDTELGLLGGLAFAVFYTAFGIPIARIADRHSRSKVIAISLTIWSVMTALCGVANSFVTLALARIGVGVGEAGCSPPAHSLLADYFAPKERSTAFGIYTLGIPIGAALGLVIGGYVNVYFGWRMAFFVVGLPGVLLAVVIALALKEPQRGLSEQRQASAGEELPKLSEVVRALRVRKTFHHICAAFALTAFAGYGSMTWIPTYYIRAFDLDTGTIGLAVAVATGLFGGISTLAGGLLADKLAKRDQRWICWLPSIAMTINIPFAVIMLLQPSFAGAVVFLFIGSLFTGVHLGPIFGVTQTLVPLRMRALAASVLLFATNIVGMGLGPLGVGFISDTLNGFGIDMKTGFGFANSLRWALIANSFVALWAVAHYLLAARTLRADIARED